METEHHRQSDAVDNSGMMETIPGPVHYWAYGCLVGSNLKSLWYRLTK